MGDGNGHLQNTFNQPVQLSYVMFQPSPPLKMQTFVLQNGRSPLYTSSCNGHLDVVKALIKAGADINQADKVSAHICSVIIIHSHMFTHL